MVFVAVGVVAAAVAVVGIVVSRSAGDTDGAAAPTVAATDAPVSGTVTSNGVDLHHPAGARLRVPTGALPAGTQVTLSPGSSPDLDNLGALTPGGSVWDVSAGGAEPASPVELTIPYDPAWVPAGANALMVTFDELSGWWLPVPTTVDEAAATLSGQLSGFSLKTWIIDQVAEHVPDGVVRAASWLEYQAGRLLRSRAGRPDCSSRPAPSWIRDVITVEDDNAQLFACAGSDGDGFTLALVNNRGYPVTVEMDTPFTRSSTSLLDQGLTGLMQRAVAATGSARVLLLGTGSGAVSYDPPPAESGLVQGWARRDGETMALWLAMEAARITGTDVPLPGGRELGFWNLDCLVSSYGNAATGNLEATAAGMTSCMEQTLRHEAASWGMDVQRDLWRNSAVAELPSGVQRVVGALRWLWAIDVARYAQSAADLWINDSGPAADLVDVSVRWSEAPRWVAPADGVYLHTLTPATSAGGATGQHLDGELRGRRYPQSTGAWIGCEGTPATLTYRLDGRYTRLQTLVGLAAFTPDGLSAQLTFHGDGRRLATVEVTRDRTASVDIELVDVVELEIAAIKTQGTCTIESLPYDVLADATVQPG